MPNRPADPGGNFASDHHRRVLANLSLPRESGYSLMEVVERVNGDDHLPIAKLSDLKVVLKELADEGLAKESKDNWKMTKRGFELLTGPIAQEPEPGEPAQEVKIDVKL